MHGDLEIAERSMDDIPREISGDLRNNILAGLWRVHSKYEEGSKWGECVTACLREAYDVYAEAHLHAGLPLVGELLTEFPGAVFQWAVARKWLTYPPMKYVPQPKRGVIDRYIVPFEPYLESELTVPFGCHKVTDWYKADILQQLASRIAYWRGEALLSTATSSATESGRDEPTTETKLELQEDPARRQGTARRRGPRRDLEGAVLIAEIVRRVAPNGDWRKKLDDIREALDESGIPCPTTWPENQNARSWSDCLEDAVVVKAIQYRLDVAKGRETPVTKTLS